MMTAAVTVTTSPAELKAAGKWSAVCEALGLHPAVAAELRDDAPIVLDGDRAEDLGLLS